MGEEHKQAALALLGEMIEMVTGVMDAARAAAADTLSLDGVDDKLKVKPPEIASQSDVARLLKEMMERKG